MLQDGPESELACGIDKAKECILKALDLDPDYLEAIEEAAHFYDVIEPDRDKAVMYAQRYLQLAGKVVDDMKAIIEDSD